MTTARLLVGDVFDGLRALDGGSVDLVVTSPPYWALARYTDDGREIGTGDLDAYLEVMAKVFDELLRVIRPTGAVWLNVGDSASGSGGSGGDYLAGGTRAGDRKYRQGKAGIPKRQWCSVPFRLVHMLQERGWLLRSTVIWDQGISKRESLDHARRPGEQWEPIFLLVPECPNRKRLAYEFAWERMEEAGNVWHFSPQSHPDHPAVFPSELVRRCLAPFPSAGSVLDPFCGSGTTLQVAFDAGKDAIGIDLDPGNVELVRQRFGMFGLEVEHVLPSVAGREAS